MNQTLLKRMIVFGGASTWGQAPTDANVYELRFTPGDADSVTWYPMTQVDLGWGFPAARYWHTLNADLASRTLDAQHPACHTAIMYGGRLNGTTCSNELWKLWIFTNGQVGWQKVDPGGNPPGWRARHSAVIDPAQSGYLARLYIFGGVRWDGSATDDSVYVLDPWNGNYTSWTRWATNLGYSLAGHTSVLALNQENVRVPETYDPTTNTWAPQDSAYMYEQFYPPSFLVPGGGGNSRIINLGLSGQQAYWLDVPPAGQPATEKWKTLPNGTTGFLAKTGVQYRPGRVLIAGGTDTRYNVTGTTLRLNASQLSSRCLPSGSRFAARFNENLVLLPTGDVLAVGGNRQDLSLLPVQWTQAWRVFQPGDTTGEWSDSTELAVQPTVRGNHSTAILLPDGRVLSAGGDLDDSNTGSDMHMGNVFCPPYLFKADGTLAQRPKITGWPDTLGWGGGCTYTLLVQDTTKIRRACLIRPGATTHSFDQNQRYVPLTMGTMSSPSRVLVSPPTSPDEAPPGDYLLFLVGSAASDSVPAIAQWVTVGSTGLDKQDQIRPAPNNDFSAVCDPNTPNGWIVSWTATADDSVLAASGAVQTDNVRRSSAHITDSNWSSASSAYTQAGYTPGSVVSFSTAVSATRYFRMKSVDNANHLSVLSPEIALFPWTSLGRDCLGGGGMFAGGGGGGGLSLARAPGSAGVRPGGENSAPATVGSAFFENSVLNGAAIGSSGRDLLRLPASIASGSVGAVRMREVSGRAAALDAARLLVVDHGSDVAAYGLEGAIVIGTRQSASRITAADGTDLTTVLNGSGSFAILPNDVLTVALGSGGGASPVVVTAGGTGALQLQVPDRQGGWRTASQSTPRIEPDDVVFAAPGADTVRIVTRGYASVSNVGRLAVSGTAPTIQVATLLAAHSARLGDVKAAATALDSVSATLVGPDTLALSYALPQATTGARDYFLVVDATPLNPQTVTPVKLGPSEQELPLRFALDQNRPNPFSGRTTIRFALPVASPVRLEIFDLQGRRVALLANSRFAPGYQAIEWDHRDSHGSQVHSGVYLYRLTAGSFRSQKKMVLLP